MKEGHALEISDIIDYEQTHTLNVVHPTNEKPLGITMQIRSEGSPAAKDVQKQHTSKNVERAIRGKSRTGEDIEQENAELAASYIASWDWGSNTYEGKKPELSMDNAIRILKKEDWLYQQVMKAARNLENFTGISGRDSAAT
jgi:hypothetical protein